MSGAELALAIVPLVIVLVEHHQTVIRKGKALAFPRSKNEQQLDFYHELHDELCLLKTTLNRVKGRSTLAGHIEEQEAAIKRVLGSNAPHFDKVLDRILRSINDLVSDKSVALVQEDVDVHHPAAMLSKLNRFKQALDSGTAVGSLRERIKFTKNEKSRTVAMYKIQTGTKKLERLLGGSTELFDQSSRATKTKAPQKRTRRLSESLYTRLASKWPKTSPCRDRHKTRLCLWNCCCTEDPDGSDDSLDVVVSMTQDERALGSQWQEGTIHVQEARSPSTGTQVHFADDRSLPHPPLTQPRPLRDIDAESFCTLFQQARANKSKLQIVFEDGKFWQKKSNGLCLHIENQQDVSLDNLLLNGGQEWSLKDRYTLAVVLAHAVLHCCGSPWLRTAWNKDHVSFFKKDSTQKPDLSRPFLAVDFEDHVAGDQQQNDLFAQHSNPMLLSLGILLLEVYNATRIESHWTAEDLTDGRHPNANTNLTAALRLLESSNGDVVLRYREAVKACLEWDSVDDSAGKEDWNLRLYEAIVRPLEQELKDGFGLTPERLQLIGVTC